MTSRPSSHTTVHDHRPSVSDTSTARYDRGTTGSAASTSGTVSTGWPAHQRAAAAHGAPCEGSTPARPIGKTKIDGDYGPFVDRLVKQTMSDNYKGAYTQAVRALYGRLARPINDGEPGPAFAHMLGIPAHPLAK